ncbi:DnaD domain protein [uncultured Lactobacillus sp.]|uniref:DnaD domain protein n=1 Tax=uncultured Lactobacillus sp. TaxID=153152 RepID=UPI00260A8B05|nr:DnaD domain protein [uncultured Lactobacillus sp.]
MASYNNYRKIGFTTISNALLNYYSQLNLSENEVMLLIQLEASSQKGDDFPSDKFLSSKMNLSPIEISELIQGLINKEIITLEQDNNDNGKISNYYNLDLLYQRLDKFVNDTKISTSTKSINKKEEGISDPIQQLVRQFEIEFGRLLSPIERQEVAAWINVDHYNPELIKMALREAVLAQVYNFKYVDRILLNWQRHSLKSPDQVKNYLQRNE